MPGELNSPQESEVDVLIVGAGPAGYVIPIRKVSYTEAPSHIVQVYGSTVACSARGKHKNHRQTVCYDIHGAGRRASGKLDVMARRVQQKNTSADTL